VPTEQGTITEVSTQLMSNPYAVAASVAERGESELRRRHGIWDTAGDLLMLGGAVSSIGVGGFTLLSGWVHPLVGIVLAVVLFALCVVGGIAAWLAAGRSYTADDALRIGIARSGGPGGLPACMGRRFPTTPFRQAYDDYVTAAGLTTPEQETLVVLQEDGFEGTLSELVETIRRLNR
jgi:hypothetical protein